MNAISTVIELELKQRIRSKRWLIALIAWFLVIGGIASLVYWTTGLRSEYSDVEQDLLQRGPITFGMITLFILGMGLVIAPTFTATSINSDRQANVLATLQATKLKAWEIAAGKLIAAWLTSLAFLLVASPFILWSMFLGNISLAQVLVCFVVVFIEVAVVCAIGLGWSALISRPAGSAVLTYLSVVAITIISLIVELLMISAVTVQEDTVRVWGLPPAVQSEYYEKVNKWAQDHREDLYPKVEIPLNKCQWHETSEPVFHNDRVWWLSLVNPFVIVADAAPLPPNADSDLGRYAWQSGDPLAFIRFLVRSSAQPPELERDECVQLYADLGYSVETNAEGVVEVKTPDGKSVNVVSPVKARKVSVNSPIWPYGMGVNLLLGGAFFWIAVRRLRVPYRRLPQGTRIA